VLVVILVTVDRQDAEEEHWEVDVCLLVGLIEALARDDDDFVEVFKLLVEEVLMELLVCLLDDWIDVGAVDDVVERFELLVVKVVLVEEVAWWLVDTSDVLETEDKVFDDAVWWLVDRVDVVEKEVEVFVELCVVLFVEDLVVEVGAGHNRGGLESYAVRIPFTAE
jgi:hypothetical protein